MGMPLMFDTHDVLDALGSDADSRDRLAEFVQGVGTWFAKRFCKSSPDDKHDILLGIRPHLRAGGFDVCDSDTGREVGCDFCMKANRAGFGDLTETWDERAKVMMVHAPIEPFIDFRVEMTESYVFGFSMPVNYCPVCGRRIMPNEKVPGME